MSKYKVLSERKYKAGYIVREELIGNYADGSGDIKMKSAYTPNGDYIGDPKTAYLLIEHPNQDENGIIYRNCYGR